MAPLFVKGSRVGVGPDQDRWLVVRKLGEGQFAEVYEVKDNHSKEDKRYALKIEKRRDVKSVKQEHKVLKRFQEKGSSLVCSVYAFGSHEDRFYMVIELLGNNVAEARKAAGGRFDHATVKRLATGMLRALEEVHAAGFVHRDVKPANFAVSPYFSDALTGVWKVIDFGLARRFLGDNNELLPERADAAFRGSTMYASVYAHQQQDLGRRDDLWSWLYCVIEMLEGTLPWRVDKEKDESRDIAFAIKQQCIQDPGRYFRAAEPHVLAPVQAIAHHLAGLGFADAPNYGHLYACLAQLPDDLQSLLPPQGLMQPPLPPGAPPGAPDMYYGQQYGSSAQQQQFYGGAQQAGWAPGGWGEASLVHMGVLAPPPQPGGPGAHVHHAHHPRGDTPASPLAGGGAGPQGGGAASLPGAPMADVAPELVEQMLAEALLLSAPGGAADDAAASASEAAREAAQCQGVQEYVDAMKQGHLSEASHDAAERLMSLEPVEAIATIGAVMEALALYTDPGSANAAAGALQALSAFGRDTARRAMARYCRAVVAAQQHQQQQQQRP